MTKDEKIGALATAMTRSKRRDNEEEEYTHFSESAPEELKSLYLASYEVRDIDYEVFSKACDILSEIYSEGKEDIDEEIYERANGSANPYTSVLLGYLNIWNQDDIAEYVKELGGDIAQACGYWYEKQVEGACFIIKNWVEAEA